MLLSLSPNIYINLTLKNGQKIELKTLNSALFYAEWGTAVLPFR